MKLKLKNTPEQVELIKAMGSRNSTEAREAQEAFAAFIGPVVQQVIQQAGTASLIFTDNEYDEDDSPSYPLDLYYSENADHITVWSQNIAGGLPTSHVEGMAEMKIATYRLDTAVTFLKKYARRARLDVLGKTIERMGQEVLLKQERNAWAVVLKALAEAQTNGVVHTIGGMDGDQFSPSDINALMTLVKRINGSWAGNGNDGTPSDFSAKGLTDLFLSPEMMEDVRGFAYNPVNDLDVGSKTTGPVTLPDNVRNDIWRSAGMSSLYGVVLHEMLEFGAGKKYNTLYKSFVDGSGLTHNAPAGSGGTRDGTLNLSNNQVLVGLDLSRDSFIRPVARHADSGSTFVAVPDDQFVSRAERIGFYGSLEEGRVCLDSRAIVGIHI
jgi:hypothetical protein